MIHYSCAREAARTSWRSFSLCFVSDLGGYGGSEVTRGLIGCFLCLAIPACSQQASIGVVLTGGGAFGAFEAGAMQGFFEQWAREHCPGVVPPCEPPIKVIAGTSTGALIGPFVALGSNGVKEIFELYQEVEHGDLLSTKLADLLPFNLFAKWSSSVFSVRPLQKLLERRLPDSRLLQIAKDWPTRRLVVVGTDFGTGFPALFGSDEIFKNPSRFRDGVLASTISPLATPPVYIKNGSSKATPHLDGGVHALSPFQALFEIASSSDAIALTHIIVFSAYPQFPTADADEAHRIQKPYPVRPKFGAIAARMDALISESSVSKEVALVWAAIELRKKGVSAEIVYKQTGFKIPTPPSNMIIFAPEQRLGWDNLRFNKTEMGKMAKLGRQAHPHIVFGDLPTVVRN
jgi:predicted acylesterase/phospholipase RssA